MISQIYLRTPYHTVDACRMYISVIPCIVVMGVKAKSRGRGYQRISQIFVSVTSK
jgi:hypothetical protein